MADVLAVPNPRTSWCLHDPLHPMGIKRSDGLLGKIAGPQRQMERTLLGVCFAVADLQISGV